MGGVKGIKRLSGELKKKGITVNVIYGGKPVFRIGSDANPGLLGIFGDVEVLDLKRTAEIFNVLL